MSFEDKVRAARQELEKRNEMLPLAVPEWHHHLIAALRASGVTTVPVYLRSTHMETLPANWRRSQPIEIVTNNFKIIGQGWILSSAILYETTMHETICVLDQSITYNPLFASGELKSNNSTVRHPADRERRFTDIGRPKAGAWNVQKIGEDSDRTDDVAAKVIAALASGRKLRPLQHGGWTT